MSCYLKSPCQAFRSFRRLLFRPSGNFACDGSLQPALGFQIRDAAERSVQRVFVIFSLRRCPCKSRIARVNESARRCVLILGFGFAALPSFARSWPSSFAKSAARLEGLWLKVPRHSCYSMCKHRISHVGMRFLPSKAPCSLGSKREIPSLTEVKTCGFCRDYPWHLGGSNLRR